MRTSDFDYELPPGLIAQTPAVRREDARLLVVRRGAPLEHRRIADLADVLPPNALLIVNDARVLPARLHAHKPTGGRVEIFVLGPASGGAWRCLIRAKSLAPGTPLSLIAPPGRHPERATVTFLGRDGEHGRIAPMSAALMAAYGEVPLPPYIERPATADDEERYQTVFARHPGAVAAPTAGLHFTRALLDEIGAYGASVAPITLHVGPGTFAPIRTEHPEEHVMHAETFVVPPETAAAHAAARATGRPIVAVGTTVVRTLESAHDAGALYAGPGETRLFIRPGHRFRTFDVLLTNFHLPRSTLLMLVCAFAGRERVLAAYREAVHQHYRFFSYGDAMLVYP